MIQTYPRRPLRPEEKEKVYGLQLMSSDADDQLVLSTPNRLADIKYPPIAATIAGK
jgi:hypothetical protein